MRGVVCTSGSQEGTSRTQRARRERGQSLVEAAAILPILLLLVAAVVDFGRAFDTYIVLTNAAREGARFGSLANPFDDDEIKTLVKQDVVGSGTNITDLSGFQESDVVVVKSTDVVTVTVAYNVDLWFGGFIGLDQFPLQKTAVMPRAQP